VPPIQAETQRALLEVSVLGAVLIEPSGGLARCAGIWRGAIRADREGLAVVATILESFDIHSPQHGKTFKIDLAEGLDRLHLDFMEAHWAPAMKRQHDLALLQFFQLREPDRTQEKWEEISGKFGVQDHHWKWRTKCSIAPGTKRRVFSLLNSGEVEAAMMLLFGENSHDQPAQPIVYIDFVAVAPWNRKAFQDPQRFHGLGTVMLGAAVEVSRTLGHDGRCGLHSLPQSEGFYRQIGMRDFGLDASKGMRYFEFDASGASTFRN
jgi:hypothetical protein